MSLVPTYEYDGFISYCQSDGSAMADFIEYALKDEAKLTIWRDKHDLKKGNKAVGDIAYGLERSRTVIAIVTEKYLNSPWCMGEFFTAVSYSNFFVILSDEIDFKDIPFDHGTTTAARYSDLKSVTSLQAFCDQVWEKGRNNKIPCGLSGSPLYELGGPALVLQLLSGTAPLGWRNETQGKRKRRLLEAVSTIQQSANENLKKGLATFSNGKYLMVGLDEMEEELLNSQGSKQEWLALAHLARPFNKRLMNRAFKKVGISEDQMRSEHGIGDEDLPPKRVRRSPRTTLSASEKRTLTEIKPHIERELTKPLVQETNPLPKQTKTERHSPSTIPKPKKAASTPQKNGEWWIAAFLVIVTMAVAAIFWILRNDINAGNGPIDPIVEVPEEPKPEEADASDLEPTSAIHVPSPIEKPSALNNEIASYCSSAGECALPDGHTLWKVSEDCFGNGSRWNEIYQINSTIVGNDPNLVQEGAKITVPVSECVENP